MTQFWRNHRWTIALALAALGLVGAAARGWWTFGLAGTFDFPPPFADTVAILAAGQARQAGADIYAVPMHFDPLGRPHVYGPAWLVTGSLGLTIDDAVWVGSVLGIVFILVAAAVLRPRSAKRAALGLLLLCSPPVILGISRGNNDLVIFLLLAAAAWSLAPQRAVGVALGAMSLATAAVLKLYPLAAVPAIVLAISPRWRAFSVLAATLAVCAAVVWFWRSDFQQAMHLAPDPLTTMAYGVKVMSLSWAALHLARGPLVLGWVLGAAVVSATLYPSRRGLLQLSTGPSARLLMYAFGAVCWAFCFVTVRSYPYRLVLVLLPAGLLLNLDGEAGVSGRMQLMWWALVGWFDPVKTAWAERARASVSLDSWNWRVFEVIIGIEQALTVVLTLALLLGLVTIWVRWLPPWLRKNRDAVPLRDRGAAV